MILDHRNPCYLISYNEIDGYINGTTYYSDYATQHIRKQAITLLTGIIVIMNLIWILNLN